SFNGATTSPLTFGASASAVQSALQGLLTMAPRTVTVTKTGNTYTVAFFTLSATDVSQRAGNQRETAIAVNPTNPHNIVIGVNDNDPVDGIFGTTSSNDHVYVSTNGGTSWTRKVIPVPASAPTDVLGARSHGDPSVVFSRDGSRIVFAHMVDKDPAGHDANN